LDPVPPPLSVGVVADYVEEGWPSMELVAELSLAALSTLPAAWSPELIRPAMPAPFRRLLGARGLNADRALGRFVAYPGRLRASRRCDRYHVTDHSYAHLVHALPPGRTLVTCHDLDAFRSVTGPEREPRPAWFRAMASWTLAGLRRAGHVVTDSETVRGELVERGVLPAARITTVPLPVHPDFRAAPDPAAGARLRELLGGGPAGPELLHVGSTAPRKRIPILLEAVAALVPRHPRVRLLRAGGALDPSLHALARSLGVADRIVELPRLDRPLLAALYRRATLVVLPSAREGFGLPLVEAMACGARVLASDLAVLREVGGDAATFVPEGARWSDAIDRELARTESPAAVEAFREAAVARSGRFSLDAHARGLNDALLGLEGP
jgi:glycosyltransferase involved in cell wall biosynthesis